MEIVLTEQNFESEVYQSDKPVLVDFWAPWCGPCRMLSPIVEQLAGEYEGKAKICKVNVDEEPGLARQFGISGIPTVLIFRDGQLADTIVGLRSKGELEAALQG